MKQPLNSSDLEGKMDPFIKDLMDHISERFENIQDILVTLGGCGTETV